MTITEEFEKRQAEKPDKWTLAWWNEQFQEVLKGYRGATHGINRALADYEDLGKSLRGALDRIQALEADRELDRAKIGELLQAFTSPAPELSQAIEEIQALKARVDRQGEFLNQLKQKRGSEPTPIPKK